MSHKCSRCDRTSDKVKLWRVHGEYFPPFTLYCTEHAVENYNDKHPDHEPVVMAEIMPDGRHRSRWEFARPLEMTWELGWCVPAIEMKEGDGWWSNWTDNPEALERWEWWKALPNE